MGQAPHHPSPEDQCSHELNHLFRDGHMPIYTGHAGRCVPITLLKINVTSNFNQLFRDGHMSLCVKDTYHVFFSSHVKKATM